VLIDDDDEDGSSATLAQVEGDDVTALTATNAVSAIGAERNRSRT